MVQFLDLSMHCVHSTACVRSGVHCVRAYCGHPNNRHLSFKIFMRISLFNFILPLLNHSEWTNENRPTIELCPLFFFFFILMRKCFVLFVFFVAYCLPKTYHKPLPIYMHSPPKKKKRKRKKTPKRKT